MAYIRHDFIKIGERIKSERKILGVSSLEEMSEIIENNYGCKISRQALSRIENGKNTKAFTVDLIDIFCEMFNCDAAYLLCEYDDCKTYDNLYIHNETGLSEKAINVLQKLKKSPFGRRLLASLEILVLDIKKFNGDKYYKRFLWLFSDYLQFSGDTEKRYSFDSNGEIKEEKPTHDEYGNKKYNKDRVLITPDRLESMFIMEITDTLRYFKKNYDKNPYFLD